MIENRQTPRRRLALLLLAIALCAVAGMHYFFSHFQGYEQIRSDGVGYYSYLPNLLIYGDPTFESVARTHFNGEYPAWTGIWRYPDTGRYLVQYTLGEPLMMAPFFYAGHFSAKLLGQPQDGFSPAYQWAAALAGTFYMILGLYFLCRLLEPYFSSAVTFAVMVSLCFGSNLFHYGTVDSIFSHAYSFCLITAFCLACRRWHESPSLPRSLLVGALLGLITLVRVPNAVAGIIFVSYGWSSPRTLLDRIRLMLRHWGLLLAAAAAALAVFSPQMMMWKYKTGRWLLMSYQGGQEFHWLDPHLLLVLFSVRKGLFFWSPLLLLALAGVWFLRRSAREWVWPVLLTLGVVGYLISCWWDWAYGASYGHRAFTDWLALFALPLGALYARIATSRWRPFVTAAVIAMTLLSIHQMLQYWHGQVPGTGPTWEEYRKLFLSF